MVILDPLAGWLTLAGLVVSIGVVAIRWFVLPSASLQPVDRALAEAAIATIGVVSAAALVAALLLTLVRQTVEFRDPFVPLSADLRLLLAGTDWGEAWAAAVLLSILLTLAFARAARGGGLAWSVATGAILLLAFYPAATGHAVAARPEHPAAVALDALHVLAAGAWAGGLAVVLLLAGTSRRGGVGGAGLRITVPAFSPLALGSAATITITGLYASWMHLPGLDALVVSPYGRLLLTKLALVGLAAAAGAVNWRRHGPALQAGQPERPMLRTATIEALLFQLVLLATAILIRTAPPS